MDLNGSNWFESDLKEYLGIWSDIKILKGFEEILMVFREFWGFIRDFEGFRES